MYSGGSYNVLLNTTRKSIAATAACLTILSYIATAVVSATEAIHYMAHVWTGINLVGFTIALLVFFAVLNIMGTHTHMLTTRTYVYAYSYHICTAVIIVCSLCVLIIVV